jgi:uncharacterized protein YbgA (DUF1722 family)/uncharacterized protein YbbK (DUF523 family)
MTQPEERIRIGISSCLLGEAVRYDGGHKRDRYLADVLSRYFEFVSYCPEVAIGLGVPRPPIRLMAGREGPRALRSTDGRDVTDDLHAYGTAIGRAAAGLSGYLLKSRSPSCGPGRVGVFDAAGREVGQSPGIFARALAAAVPLLPIEDEGRLSDPDLRDNFIERVCAYQRWQRTMADGLTPAALVRFHTEHEFLLMAHGPAGARRLGRLAAQAGAAALPGLAADYLAALMAQLARPARRGDQANVLMHLAGFLEDRIDRGDRAELGAAIDGYRRGATPIIVPITLLRHHLRGNSDDHLAAQVCLDRAPGEPHGAAGRD